MATLTTEQAEQLKAIRAELQAKAGTKDFEEANKRYFAFLREIGGLVVNPDGLEVMEDIVDPTEAPTPQRSTVFARGRFQW